MTTKIFLPTDSLNLYTQAADELRFTLTVARRCSIKTHPNDFISVVDELDMVNIVEPALYSDLKDESGDPIGATFADALTYLSVIVG